MIPETLDGWTLDVVRSLIAQGVFESDRFDFKEKLPHKNDEHGKRRLRHACAAFANSGGGFLILGVRDERDIPANNRIVGMARAMDFPQQFGNYPSACEPSVPWGFKNPAIELDVDRVLHVVWVPSSGAKPHATFDDERWFFPKRTNKGTEVMSYDEIRGAFLDWGRRANELAWLRAEVERIGLLARHLHAQRSQDAWPSDALLSRLDAQQLKTLLVSVFGFLGGDAALFTELNNLVDASQLVDRALTTKAAFAFQPRDRSFSGSRADPLEGMVGHFERVINGAMRIKRMLDERGL